MFTNNKYYLMLFLVISCSIQTIAQTGYYYKGKKIPLTVNDDKVCVCMSKDDKIISERICKNVQILTTIKDETFDIYVISQSDYEKLISLDSWKEDTKSVLLTPTYITTEKQEVYSTPYLNIRLKKEQDLDMLVSSAEQYGLNIIRQNLYMPLCR